MKTAYLIHGWGGNSSYFDELKKQLEKKKIRVYALDMPDTDNPKIEAWVGLLEKNAKNIDKDTYFVGHSIGCQTIMRFLERLPIDKEIAGAVFIAGWINLKGLDSYEKLIAKPWLETPINCDKAKRRVKKIVAIFSDNDNTMPLENKDFFKDRLGAKVFIEHQKGHFRGDDGITELPSALEALLKMARQ